MSFYLNFIQPSTGQNLKLKELNFYHYKTLNKFLINNNNFHIAEYFDDILNECLVEENSFSSFTNFDKFCALVLLRCTCVSPEIEYNVGATSAKSSLLPFLKRCLDLKIDFNKTVKVDDNIEVIFSLPKSLYFETVLDALQDTIFDVFYQNKKVIYNNKKELIETLPAEVFKYAKKFSEEIDSMFSEVKMNIGVKEKDQFAISPFNLSFFEILKALYLGNLKNIIELQYVLVNKCRYSAEYVDKYTLAENLILANIYETEVKKINEEQSKSMETQVPGIK